MTVREVIATCIGGTTETHWSWQDKTMTIVNGNPTFSNYVFEDIKSESLELTGNNQYLINNYNKLQVTISDINKAIANKEASMTKYRLVCGNKSDEKSYSANNDVILTIDNVTNQTFTLYAIDSRGNSTTVSKTAEQWKDYTNPVITRAEVERTNGVSKETKLLINGTFWKGEGEYDFGAVANEIVSCTYKYKKTNESEYGEEISISPTVDGTSIHFYSTILGDAGAEGFELSNSYNIQIKLVDKIRTVTYDVLLGAGSPAMAIHKDGVSFGAPYDTNEGGPLQVYGKSINTYSTNEVIVGTWTNREAVV